MSKKKFSKIHLIAIAVFISMLYSIRSTAQIAIKTEWIGQSDYYDENKSKLDGSGMLFTSQLGIQLPLSVKYLHEEDSLKIRPTAWISQAKGTFAYLANKGNATIDFPTKIINAQVGLIYTQPISPKWSIISMAGMGMYSMLDNMDFRDMLGQAGIIFFRQMNPNLKLGGGVALNNILGYPMIFPTIYFDWSLRKKYSFKVSLYDSFELSAGMAVSRKSNLSLFGSANSVNAIMRIHEKKQIYICQYSVAGLSFESLIAKSFMIKVAGGVSINREAYFQDLKIKAFLTSKETNPHFGVAPYISIVLKYGM